MSAARDFIDRNCQALIESGVSRHHQHPRRRLVVLERAAHFQIRINPHGPDLEMKRRRLHIGTLTSYTAYLSLRGGPSD